MKVLYLQTCSLAILAIILPNCMGKTFTRCNLAIELVRQGLSEEKINDWVCLVENESARNTSAIGRLNADGSLDYGLFQISELWWCSFGFPGGDCNMNCEDLIDDDITDDVQCVKKIYRIHGFTAWHGWTQRCSGQQIPDVHHCFE